MYGSKKKIIKTKLSLIQPSYVQQIFILLLLELYNPLLGLWPPFQFLNLMHSRQDSTDERSARRRQGLYLHT
jgi:hypothetical protein